MKTSQFLQTTGNLILSPWKVIFIEHLLYTYRALFYVHYVRGASNLYRWVESVIDPSFLRRKLKLREVVY